jgi:hypothetical protein
VADTNSPRVPAAARPSRRGTRLALLACLGSVVAPAVPWREAAGPTLAPMRLRERLEIRGLADGVYHAHAGEQYRLQALADVHGEDGVLDWLRYGLNDSPTWRPHHC